MLSYSLMLFAFSEWPQCSFVSTHFIKDSRGIKISLKWKPISSSLKTFKKFKFSFKLFVHRKKYKRKILLTPHTHTKNIKNTENNQTKVFQARIKDIHFPIEKSYIHTHTDVQWPSFQRVYTPNGVFVVRVYICFLSIVVVVSFIVSLFIIISLVFLSFFFERVFGNSATANVLMSVCLFVCFFLPTDLTELQFNLTNL